MERVSKQTGIAAADHGQEKRLHFPKAIRQPGRKRSIMVKEPPIACLPSFGSLTLQLYAKVFTNERMRIEISSTVRIFPSEKSRSS
jgi:hypothetical protein